MATKKLKQVDRAKLALVQEMIWQAGVCPMCQGTHLVRSYDTSRKRGTRRVVRCGEDDAGRGCDFRMVMVNDNLANRS